MFTVENIATLQRQILNERNLYPKLNKQECDAIGNIAYTANKLKAFMQNFLDKKECKNKKRILVLSPAACFFENNESRLGTKRLAYHQSLEIMHELSQIPETMIFDSFKCWALLNQKNTYPNISLFDDKFITFFLHDALQVGLFHSVIFIKCKSFDDSDRESSKINSEIDAITSVTINLLEKHPRRPQYAFYENSKEAKDAHLAEFIANS